MTRQSVLPAEWYPQDAILITWPHPESAWQYMLQEVEETYFDLTTKLSHYQPILIQLHASIDLNLLLQTLSESEANLSNCHFIRLNSNDTWARDHGPIGVLGPNSTIEMLDFEFNGWGNKFDASLDNQLNKGLFSASVLSQGKTVEWVLEGGSIESDGQGTLMTTRQCVLNENRNGKVSQGQVEELFSRLFGARRIIWLDHGELEGDDTDAHIDTLARFAPNNHIIFQGCQDSSDSHYTSLSAMKLELQRAKNALNEPFKLIELPLPKAVYADDGHRLPATYANFLITNKLVLVPTYGDLEDNNALERIADVFPEHITIGINALPLIEEHGSLHCITMQLPKGSVNFEAPFEHITTSG